MLLDYIYDLKSSQLGQTVKLYADTIIKSIVKKVQLGDGFYLKILLLETGIK